ncbi:RNA-binding protein Musashi homolog Rbp6-like isoform X3 [Myzus persicae]|nr:RNA-binding protein Musashi homolog Rbp6-like isoform X3 [Myzus persicae]XP_022182175.1 RNA-binding protein Musashi homolog Rbp6-like isoform X3 [Myzus persicae]
MSNYHHQAAAVAAQGFGPPASPHTGGPGNPRAAAFPPATSPGPGAPSTMDMYSSNPADYVQAASPQPSAFPAIAVSRAPINYNPGPLIPAAFTNGYH